MVRERGVEPLHRLVLDPKSSASTSSATLANFQSTIIEKCRSHVKILWVVELFFIFLRKAFYYPLVRKTEIVIVAYDDMIQYLNHEQP